MRQVAAGKSAVERNHMEQRKVIAAGKYPNLNQSTKVLDVCDDCLNVAYDHGAGRPPREIYVEAEKLEILQDKGFTHERQEVIDKLWDKITLLEDNVGQAQAEMMAAMGADLEDHRCIRTDEPEARCNCSCKSPQVQFVSITK